MKRRDDRFEGSSAGWAGRCWEPPTDAFTGPGLVLDLWVV